MEKIISSVCDFFNIDKEKVIEKTNKGDISLIRNYIYYILHCDYNYSVGQICKFFNRCRREVFYRISETKYRIGYFVDYNKEYKAIKAHIEEKERGSI